jgi:ADP-ribose pyrophosphatase YjhB (NUDIX family)
MNPMRQLKEANAGAYPVGSVLHGLAIVPRVHDHRRDGWAIPGGRITSSYDEAARIARRMDAIMRGRA